MIENPQRVEESKLNEKVKLFYKEVKQFPDRAVSMTIKARQGKIVGYGISIDEPV